MDHQDQESDIRGQSGESEGKANSKLDGLFGPTSNVCLSTPTKDGLPPSHQDGVDAQGVEVVQHVLQAAENSATVDPSDGVNSSTDDTPPTTTTPTSLTSPEYPRTALHPSPPPQHPPPLDNGFGTLSTIDDASVETCSTDNHWKHMLEPMTTFLTQCPCQPHKSIHLRSWNCASPQWWSRVKKSHSAARYVILSGRGALPSSVQFAQAFFQR